MAKPCRNEERDLDIHVRAEASPCPMSSSSEHKVTITNDRNREVQGEATSITRHGFAEFDSGDRVTKYFVLNPHKDDAMNGKLIRGSRGKGQDTVETSFNYRDETEEEVLYSEHINVDYWIEVL